MRQFNAELFSRSNIVQLFKYGIVSVAYYMYVFVCIYVLVDFFALNSIFSYIVTYGIAYITEYFINIRILFHVQHKKTIFIKYIAHIIFFLVVGSFLFSACYGRIGSSFVALILTTGCLFPLRFLSYKYLVYR